MNQHFKKLREALDRERSKAPWTSDDSITDPYSSMLDSYHTVFDADQDIEDAAWSRQMRREAPKGKRYKVT